MPWLHILVHTGLISTWFGAIVAQCLLGLDSLFTFSLFPFGILAQITLGVRAIFPGSIINNQ